MEKKTTPVDDEDLDDVSMKHWKALTSIIYGKEIRSDKHQNPQFMGYSSKINAPRSNPIKYDYTRKTCHKPVDLVDTIEILQPYWKFNSLHGLI